MPSAKHLAICDAIEGIVQGLGISGLKVVVREEINRIENEALPMCIITMGDEQDEQYLTGGDVLRVYQVVVSTIAASNLQLETDIGTAKGIRQSIRKKLTNDSTVGVPSALTALGVFDLKMGELPEGNPQQFAAMYDVARLGVIVRTSELIQT